MVVAHQGGHVEGDGEAVVTGRQQVLVALVRLFHRAEAAEHADRPGLAAIAGLVDAAGVGVVAGQVEVAFVVQVSHVRGVVEALDGTPGDRHEWPSQLLAFLHDAFVVLLPKLLRAVQFVAHGLCPRVW